MGSCLSFLFVLVRLAKTFEMPIRTRATFSMFLSCHRLSIPIPDNPHNEDSLHSCVSHFHSRSTPCHCLDKLLRKLYI